MCSLSDAIRQNRARQQTSQIPSTSGPAPVWGGEPLRGARWRGERPSLPPSDLWLTFSLIYSERGDDGGCVRGGGAGRPAVVISRTKRFAAEAFGRLMLTVCRPAEAADRGTQIQRFRSFVMLQPEKCKSSQGVAERWAKASVAAKAASPKYACVQVFREKKIIRIHFGMRL